MLGWILLGLLGLLLLLLVVPIGLELRYRDGDLRLRMRVLGCKVMLVPARPKRPRKQPPAKPETAKPETAKVKKAKEPVPFMDILQTINDLLPEVGRVLGSLLRHITVKRLRVQLPIDGDDAAEVGIRYGQLQALCYNIYAYIASAVRLREWQLTLQPDWTGDNPTPTSVELWLRVTPLAALAILLRFLLRGGVILYRSPYIQFNSKTKKTKKTKIKKTKEGTKNATDTNR